MENDKVVLVGTVETVVAPILETENGFTSEECVNAIKNKKMQGAVKAYYKAFVAGRESDWKRAKAVARMSADMRKEFGDDKNLAAFLGLNSKSEFSKLRRAGAIAIEAEKKGYKQLPSLSVVTEMLVLEGEKYGKQELLPILKKVTENENTVAEVRDLVKSYKKDNTKKVEKQETVKIDEQGGVKGKVNESPMPNLDTALVWVDGKAFSKLAKKDRQSIAKQINDLLAENGIAVAVMTGD